MLFGRAWKPVLCQVCTICTLLKTVMKLFVPVQRPNSDLLLRPYCAVKGVRLSSEVRSTLLIKVSTSEWTYLYSNVVQIKFVLALSDIFHKLFWGGFCGGFFFVKRPVLLALKVKSYHLTWGINICTLVSRYGLYLIDMFLDVLPAPVGQLSLNL